MMRQMLCKRGVRVRTASLERNSLASIARSRHFVQKEGLFIPVRNLDPMQPASAGCVFVHACCMKYQVFPRGRGVCLTHWVYGRTTVVLPSWSLWIFLCMFACWRGPQKGKRRLARRGVCTGETLRSAPLESRQESTPQENIFQGIHLI